jgi:putative restriction endonuclease
VENRIELSPELVGAFKSIWNVLVDTGHSPLIAQPYFYLRSEGFWHHVPNPGFEEWVRVTRNCQAIGVLHRAVAFVSLDPELFALLTSPVEREVLKDSLMRTYFSGSQYGGDSLFPDYLAQVQEQILAGSGEAYAAEVQAMQASLDKDTFEEEVFVRGGLFKREVPRVYKNTCCISGLRVETTVNASLIDACHIVPFSESHDDTIANGLSLCPTLHRAFDRGLIAVEPDHLTVLVSKRMSEPVASVYSVRQFEGQSIHKPEEERWWPGRDNLARHLERFAANF